MIFTIGHSDHSPDRFLGMLDKHRIGTVIDIRTHTASKWAHFNPSAMIDPDGWLAENGIGYQWQPLLAGWQKKHAIDTTLVGRMQEVGVDLRTYNSRVYPRRVLRTRVGGAGHGWERRHEFDFSWYTVMPEFQVAALDLMSKVTRGLVRPPVLMCSEYDWTACHRAQVSDFMAYHHGGVNHLVGDEVVPHDWYLLNRMNRYDKDVVAAWGGKAHVAS